jgi:hypothetical protein
VLVGDAARVPLVALVPLHPPDAVHEVALVEDQVTVEILPDVMLVGLAEIVTVGGAVGAGVCGGITEPDVPTEPDVAKSKSILATTGG